MPSITLTPTSGNPGVTITVKGTGFTKSQRIKMLVDKPDGAVKSYKCTLSGTFTGKVITGSASSIGTHTVDITSATSTTVLAHATFTLVAPTPPPPTLTITAGPTATATDTTASIAWTVSEPATGQVKYGLTTSYGQASTEETSYTYAAHTQPLSGLTAGATYHFKVEGHNAAGTTYSSADKTFTTTGVVIQPPPPTGSFPPDTTLKTTPANNDSMPSYLGVITDSTYGTKVRRVSNVNEYRNPYPRIQSWSKDELYVALMWNGGRRLLNGTTYADIGRVPDGSGNEAWSNVQPHRMYGVTGHDGNILQWEPGQAGWTVIDTIPYGNLYLGNYEGGLSRNDIGALLGDGQLITYDFANKRVMATRPWSGDMADTSVSGQYVVADDNSRTVLLDTATLNIIRYMVSNNGGSARFGHQDLGLDAAGNDVLVYVNPNGDGVNCQRLDNGADVYVVGGIYGVGHVSCTNYERPGWAYLTSNSNYTGTPGWDQVVAAKLDGSQTVQVFARMHDLNPATHQVYDLAPYGAASRKGDKVIFGSVWSDTASTPIYCYIAGVNP